MKPINAARCRNYMRRLAFLAVAICHPAWADRQAAEHLAAEAERTGDAAAFVTCGQAFLDVYNQDPTAKDADEIVFDAARCFERGKSITAALSADSIVLEYFPRSHLAAKSLVHSGMMYEQIAFYDRAAERFEEYARKYAGEKDAYDVQADAIRLRAALGDVEKQISDTNYFITTFGRRQPTQAAAAQLALLPALDGDRAIALLREYLKHFAKVDANRTIAVHVELADRLRAKSCPVHGIDHLCVKLVVDHSPHCGSGNTSVVAVKRTSENREADAEYLAAIALFEHDPQPASRHAQAMARLALADEGLEAMIAATFPHDLDFNVDPYVTQQKSTKLFSAWLDDEKRLGLKLDEAYSLILAQKDPASSVAAAARIGQTSLTFWRAFTLGEIPKGVRTNPKRDAYCDQVRNVSDGLRARAIEVFSTCIAKAQELGAGQEWADVCWREGNQLEPVEFAAVNELRGAAAASSPIALEPPITSPPLP